MLMRGIGLRPHAGFDDVKTQNRPTLRCCMQGGMVSYAQIALEPNNAVAHQGTSGAKRLDKRSIMGPIVLEMPCLYLAKT